MPLTENKQKGRFRLLSIILATSIVGWLFTWLSIGMWNHYGGGLFILLPFVLGFVATLGFGYKHTLHRPALFRVSFSTLVVYSIGLLLFAWEGLICILMAWPLGFAFSFLGHLLAYVMLKRFAGNTRSAITLLLISVPLFMAFEGGKNSNKVRSVTTAIEINASPSQVWNNVVTFSRLEEPTEFIFSTGIAYPVDATIKGTGVGATRYCNFTTGPFIEPITVWDEPRLLNFSVTSQPIPMKEISPFDIHPPHLDGYWRSVEGQFKLTELPNGNTLLEGTTWYINQIDPEFYWAVWSDYIVHAIHKRVLQHIKLAAEQ